jgi:ABC-2 type transport system permease protein
MTSTLASITLRSLLNRRRTLLLALASALVVLVAALYRLSSPSDAEALDFAGQLLADFGIGVVLPLVAVIVGTAAIGSEIEDGTIVYLLSKPVPRLTIIVVKLLVAWLVTCLIVVPGIWIGGIVATGGDPDVGTAYAVAVIVGGLEYTALFVALSLMTSRALVVGLAYVVVWEGVVAGLFAGTRLLSVRQHTLWVADAIGEQGVLASDLGPAALLVLAVVTAAAFVIALRRLEQVELRGETG